MFCLVAYSKLCENRDLYLKTKNRDSQFIQNCAPALQIRPYAQSQHTVKRSRTHTLSHVSLATCYLSYSNAGDCCYVDRMSWGCMQQIEFIHTNLYMHILDFEGKYM